MTASLVLSPAAADDIADAYDWYELHRRGLGEEFLACTEACLASVSRNPQLYARIYGEFRRALVRRFPYAVFYQQDGDKVTVFAVFHTSRNPEKWSQRVS
jgi:plasmid stabilization system protein ParE